MRLAALILSATLIAAGLGATRAADTNVAEPLVPLARIGPWSGVSTLIAYRGRLWFTNSVKYVNHNSADLYSYEPATGRVRYERHLFSQDAGDPVIHGGLMYWPFEDPRWSPGRGEFMVTDGTDWRWILLPDGQAFHVHVMAEHDGALYAATSAWKAQLQRSRDGGAQWHLLYEHETPEDGISRITSMTRFRGTLYTGLVARYRVGTGLLRLVGDDLVPVTGWPEGRATKRLTSWNGHLYAVVEGTEGSAVWRTDGRRSERVTALDGRLVRDLEAGPEAIWAITAADAGGTLLRSADGLRWEPVQTFGTGEPADLVLAGGRPFVGTIGPGSAGCLWGPPNATIPAAATMPSPLPDPSRPLTAQRRETLLATLDRLLADPQAYRRGNHRSEALRRLARSREAATGDALQDRLGGNFPNDQIGVIGGNLVLPASAIARWYLLWALAQNGHGRVSPDLIAVPWNGPTNRAEKYFDPAPGAAWAATMLDQKDRKTLSALIERLDRTDDPLWLRGDIVGALTALTGHRFGYEVDAWRAWWQGSAPEVAASPDSPASLQQCEAG